MRAVIAFGHVKEKETLRERMIAGSIKRGIKEIEEMLSAEEMPANWVINGLRCVMCAPSAAHRQPVIFHETHGVVTAMVEESTRDNLLDLGIAKLHFEIGAGNGRWNFGNGGSYEHITPQHNKKENHPSADKEDTDRNDI